MDAQLKLPVMTLAVLQNRDLSAGKGYILDNLQYHQLWQET